MEPKQEQEIKTCKRCLMHTGIPSVVIHEDGECNFCKIHDKLEVDAAKFDFDGFVSKLRTKNDKYHCLIGISGGLDSSFLLEYTVKTLKLRPLVIHFDNFWNSKEANSNITAMVTNLNVDFIRYHINRQEYDEVCKSLLYASVSDADIANDMAMAYFMLKVADEYGIKWIFNGHDFRKEGTSPLCFSYMDALYLKNIHTFTGGLPLRHFPLLTFGKQLWYALKGIRHIRPLYYINFDNEKEAKRLADTYGWKPYGDKHSENDYTWLIGSYLLPNKFDIDKRITYQSALMRSGLTTRDAAERILSLSPLPEESTIEVVKRRLGFSDNEWDEMMLTPRRYYTEFKTYKDSFKRWKWLLWLLMKIRVFPYTFYTKYVS